MTRGGVVLRIRLALVTLLCWSVSVAAVVLPQTIGSRNVLVPSETMVLYAFCLALPILALCLVLVVAAPHSVLRFPTRWATVAAALLALFVLWLDSPAMRNPDFIAQLWLGGMTGILLCWALLKRDAWHVGGVPGHHPS